MKQLKKSEYLQIRVSKQEKEIIKSSAQLAEVDMSAWILQRILHEKAKQFINIINKLIDEEQSFVFAELHDFLAKLMVVDLEMALSVEPVIELTGFQINYVIAMIVHRSKQLNISPPTWINNYPVLLQPVFATSLKSLSLHLLINSPIAFKQRNIFIDSSIGDRV
ncbi:MAG: DUF1778 domain-containing protein [Proteobacteria bacterium]|nr:DUF1778 domain-containing protein [Pseudomonadota bacterium]